MRIDGRAIDELRPVHLTPGYVIHPEGSVLIEVGQTRVLCTATVDERVPGWMAGTGRGWVTGEYAMLPRATHTRTPRETGGLRGRTQEIRRLIGRSLRAAVNLNLLGERQVIVDCDVLQADGGTRTASITGGWIALALALQRLRQAGALGQPALRDQVAAVSVGHVDGAYALDLNYREDSSARVDLNVVATARGGIVEIQGTAEGEAVPRAEVDEMIDLALKGIDELCAAQTAALRAAGVDPEALLIVPG